MSGKPRLLVLDDAQWSDQETLEYFTSALVKFSTVREDIRTWADLLDLDDFVSFGGKA